MLSSVILAAFMSTTAIPDSTVKEKISREFSSVQGTFALAFKDLQTGEEILINEQETFHAASTMKTPVMIEVYKQAAAGKFALSDSVTIHQNFNSIADGSEYILNQESDSDQELYKLKGRKMDIYGLMYRMIIRSSNLATNMIIELAGAKNINQTMRDIGANDIRVLRGVEDIKAYEKGMNNTTNAYDQMLIYSALAKGEIPGIASTEPMINILLRQEFNEVIPARLPKDVKVAHKTGNITGIQHDAGIVYLPDGRKYVLVLLSKGLKDEKEGIAVMSRASELVYKSISQ